MIKIKARALPRERPKPGPLLGYVPELPHKYSTRLNRLVREKH